MEVSLVSSDGKITIPKEICQQLDIKPGSKISAIIVDQHIELYINDERVPSTGFAMLKSEKKSIPSDFDTSSLLNHDRN